MKFLLDTDAVIAVQKRREAVLTWLRKQRRADVVVSTVTLHELYYGAFKSRHREQNLAALQRLQFVVIPFGEDAAIAAGRVRAQTARQPIGPYDALIAGHAQAAGLVLVTHNMREFARVPGLVALDWNAG